MALAKTKKETQEDYENLLAEANGSKPLAHYTRLLYKLKISKVDDKLRSGEITMFEHAVEATKLRHEMAVRINIILNYS